MSQAACPPRPAPSGAAAAPRTPLRPRYPSTAPWPPSSAASSPGRAASVSMARARSRQARSGSASRRVKENASPRLRRRLSSRDAAPLSANMVLSASGSSAAWVSAASSSKSRSRAASGSLRASAAIASACSPISAGKRARPSSTARLSSGLEPGAAERLRLGGGRAGRGRKRPPPWRARLEGGRPGPALLLRQGQRVEAAEQLEAILVAHVRILDRGDMIDQPPARPARCSGVASGSASRSCRQSRSTSDSGVASRASSAARPPRADQIVGILARRAG